MKTTPLLPPIYRKIGWALLVPSFITLIVYLFFDSGSWLVWKVYWPHFGGIFDMSGGTPNKIDIALTILLVANLLAFSFVALSKEKIEDECIAQIRARSMVIALWFSTALVLLATLFCFGLLYLQILMFNIFFYLAIYILVFSIALAKFYKSQADE